MVPNDAVPRSHFVVASSVQAAPLFGLKIVNEAIHDGEELENDGIEALRLVVLLRSFDHRESSPHRGEGAEPVQHEPEGVGFPVVGDQHLLRVLRLHRDQLFHDFGIQAFVENPMPLSEAFIESVNRLDEIVQLSLDLS